MLHHFKKALLTSTILAIGLSVTSIGHAASTQKLSGVDKLLTTIVSKSKIKGGLEKDANGVLVTDAIGNFKFNYSGDIYYPATSPLTGQLTGTVGPVGKVSGQAGFPMEFANLAIQIYAWLQSGADPTLMPAIPSKINWVMNDITIQAYGNTYRPIDNPDMALDGRAFTGLGPVEIGVLLNDSDGTSLSVRMGGCFAVQGVSGPNTGKVGTQCMNGTFTFDLAGIDLTNPMASTLNGTGTSNCTTVLHKPAM